MTEGHGVRGTAEGWRASGWRQSGGDGDDGDDGGERS